MLNGELVAALAVRAKFKKLHASITGGRHDTSRKDGSWIAHVKVAERATNTRGHRDGTARKDVGWIADVKVDEGTQQNQCTTSSASSATTASTSTTLLTASQQDHGSAQEHAPMPTILPRTTVVFSRQSLRRKGTAEAETAISTGRKNGHARTAKGVSTDGGKSVIGGSATGAIVATPRVQLRRKNGSAARPIQPQQQQQQRDSSSASTAVATKGDSVAVPTSPKPPKKKYSAASTIPPSTRPKRAKIAKKAECCCTPRSSASCAGGGSERGDTGVNVAATGRPPHASADVVETVTTTHRDRSSARFVKSSPLPSRKRSRAHRVETPVPEQNSPLSPDSAATASSSPPPVPSRVCGRVAATFSACSSAASTCTAIAVSRDEKVPVVVAGNQEEPTVVTVVVAAVKTTPVPAVAASPASTATTLAAAPAVGAVGAGGVAVGNNYGNNNNKVDFVSMVSGSKTSSHSLNPTGRGRKAAPTFPEEETGLRLKLEETAAPTARNEKAGAVDAPVVGPRLLRARMEREARRAAAKAATAQASAAHAAAAAAADAASAPAAPAAAAAAAFAANSVSKGATSKIESDAGGVSTTGSVSRSGHPAADSTQHMVATPVQLPVTQGRHDWRDADDALSRKRHRANNYCSDSLAEGGGDMVDAASGLDGECGAAVSPRRGLVDLPPAGGAWSHPQPGPLASVQRQPEPPFAELLPTRLGGGESVVRREGEAFHATDSGSTQSPPAASFQRTTHGCVDVGAMLLGGTPERATSVGDCRVFPRTPRFEGGGERDRIELMSPSPRFPEPRRWEAGLGFVRGGTNGLKSGGGAFDGGGGGGRVELISPPPRLPRPRCVEAGVGFVGRNSDLKSGGGAFEGGGAGGRIELISQPPRLPGPRRVDAGVGCVGGENDLKSGGGAFEGGAGRIELIYPSPRLPEPRR